MRWTRVGLLAAILVLLTVGSASGGNEENLKRHWQERYGELITGVAHAERRYEQSRAAYTKAKQRERLQGERKTAILEEMKSAELQLSRLTKELKAFPEEARRSGIPPGWLREVEDRT